MDVRRVAIVYDDAGRPETTGGYCLAALRQFAVADHFRPGELESVPAGYDLYLNVDEGLRYRLPGRLRPSAWWAIDTHLDLPWYVEKAPGFDFVFAAQKRGAEELRARRITAEWLPLACDPAVHRRHVVPKRHDLCFVGNVFPGERERLLRLIAGHFPSCFIGRKFFDEMAESYSASRIVFNRSIRDDVNMRVFEALACGSMLLANALPGSGQDELFSDGTHLATYADAEELVDKARFYLGREELRERIAEAGMREAVAKHTYRHRMERMLQVVAAGHGGRRTPLVDKEGVTAPDGRAPVAAPSLETPALAITCHPERSEGSLLSPSTDTEEILRCAQDDGGSAPVAGAKPPAQDDKHPRACGGAAPPEGRLRVLYLGVFASPWTIEQAAAEAMRRRGHHVDAVDEQAAGPADALVERLREGSYDCLLFSKGRMGARSVEDTLFTTGEDIEKVIRATDVPCYTWYFDRALGYEPSREQWMRRVAPLCRVAFVVDGPLTRTDWAKWHWLQQGFRPSDLRPPLPASATEARRRFPVGFIGSVYGGRAEELEAVSRAVEVKLISDAVGPDRHAALHQCEIILGPRYPATAGYWSDRLYLVLGHGAFFLAPEVEGMREDGFEPGVHYVPLGPDPAADVRYWLARPEERRKIALAGQELVLRRFTYDHRVEELCRVIAGTLKGADGVPLKRFEPSVGRRAAAVPAPAPTRAGPPPTGKAAPSPDSAPADGPVVMDGGYFDWPRPDLLELVPTDARRVLDLGCGSGRLGEAIKERQGAHVTGVELDPAAAERASARLDRVLVGDVEEMALPFAEAEFDAVVCGDVLEHLCDPPALLTRIRGWLAPGGRLVASIPNVRHHSVVRALLAGDWTYEPAGLLDETHLRFFTRRRIERMFREAGYDVMLRGSSPFPDLEAGRRRPSPTVRLGNLRVTGLPAEEAEEFFVYQYLAVATPAAQGPAADVPGPAVATSQGVRP